MLDFIFDSNGRPFVLKYTNGTAASVTYYYVLNLQGDVVKLIEADGTVAAQYTYNAWGEVLTATGTMAEINPLRYRGYYYDTETGFYYLQSRYYDPVMHRFINADSYQSTGVGILGCNMFAYCNNSPISFSDSSGQIIELEDGATAWEIEQYERAVVYLKTSEAGRTLIERLERSDVVFTIIFVDNNKTEYNFDERNIYFDADCGTLLIDQISVQSPSIALAHEMGHAAQYLDGRLDAYIQSDRLGRDLLRLSIEEQNLEMYETPIAKQLGEPYRNHYLEGIEPKTMNNSTHYQTKGFRPLWHYIFTWNLFRSPIITIEHNAT